MHKLLLIIGFVLSFLALPVAAESGVEGGPAVDLDEVREQGIVSSTDGIAVTGQPDEAALAVFAESGYAAVIDLRGPTESRGIDEASVVKELGMDYVALPIAGREAISFDNARKLAELIDQYDEPVLVHCGSGNRAAALLALDQAQQGVETDEAIAYGKRAGLTRLESLVRKRIADSVNEESSQ